MRQNMRLFKKILVPVDGSRYSRDAVCLASQLAKLHGSELKIIHVLDASLLDQLARLSEKDKETVRQELIHSARGFLWDMEREAAKEQIPLEVVIKEGVPHEVILQEAPSWGADLIVMGKLGRRGVSHILVGSVTERVIEFSETPVLVVK